MQLETGQQMACGKGAPTELFDFHSFDLPNFFLPNQRHHCLMVDQLSFKLSYPLIEQPVAELFDKQGEHLVWSSGRSDQTAAGEALEPAR